MQKYTLRDKGATAHARWLVIAQSSVHVKSATPDLLRYLILWQ
jgi:hypothetical protein